VTRILLDTNTASALIKGRPNVAARFRATDPERVCLSVVTEAELLYGLAKRPQASRLRALVEAFLTAIDVLPWTGATTRRYANLRAGLERRGRPLGALDTMIAAHAIEHDVLLVTNDRAFGEVPELRLEDWTAG
jgi:tRNA(fMet)-specific endonuclease VapC